MTDNNCAYCMEGELVAKFGIKICELETSKVYLFKEQSHPGRCIVAHKKHVGDMNEYEWGGVFLMNPDQKYLSDEEYADMIAKIKANL